jgi:hypothetical protein
MDVNIQMEVEWTEVTQDRVQYRILVDTVMKIRVTLKVGNLLKSRTLISF